MIKLNNMTKQDFNFLKNFDENFYTAIKSNFSRNISRSNLEKFSEIIEKETGKTINTNYNCGICCLNLIKKMAELYYAEKNKVKKEE